MTGRALRAHSQFNAEVLLAPDVAYRASEPVEEIGIFNEEIDVVVNTLLLVD
jgi:hypothetical protein